MLAGVAAGAASSIVNPISGGNFEAPALAAGAFRYSPSGSPWTFAGGAGVSSNNSGFTWSNPAAPNGTQVGFVQGTGSMTQSVYLDAGAYSLSMLAAQRGVSQSRYQQLAVLVDGTQVGVITPTSTQYGSYQTSNFQIATAGMHTVRIVGLNPLGGGNTAFVDNVAIAAAVNSISDGSFEAPGLTPGIYAYRPGSSPWTFAGGAGVTTNSTGFSRNNPNAPVGAQVAFVQGTGSMTQSAYLEAGTYSISMLAAQRGASQSHYQRLAVLVDGVQVGVVTPTSTQYSSYQTASFSVTTDGMHTVQITGLNPLGGDNTALLDDLSISAANPISRGSFEMPRLASKTYQVAPGGTPWTFAGKAGVSSNDSDFTSSNPDAPDGTQVAFVQGTGSMTQSVYLDAGAYSLSLTAAQRAVCQSRYQQLAVLVDGVRVGVITPTSVQYGSYQTPNFQIATAGMHTVQIAGLNPLGGDNTALVDKVLILTAAKSVVDGSFEMPGLAWSAYQYGPTGSPWSFDGQAGVSNNGSSFTVDNPDAPDGEQVGFVQGTGSMTQSVYLDAGAYSLSLSAAQRAVTQSHYQQLAVLVDGAQVGVITPTSTEYRSYQTPSFPIATTGLHIVQIAGLNPEGGDNTAFVDKVSISAAETVSDGSFEVSALTPGTYQSGPTGSLWQFAGTAGVNSNGSALNTGGPTAPGGTQVAFLQGTGSMSQSVYLSASTYSISFQAAQLTGAAQSQYQQIAVLVDGAQVGVVTPTSNLYHVYQTPSFTIASAGLHTLQFLGLDSEDGDNLAFLDKIQVAIG